MTTLDEKLKRYFNEMFSCPDSDIYHYTKEGVGDKIIRSGFFRLKSHHDLNKKDNGELIVGPELTKKYLKKTNLAPLEPTFDKFLECGITMYVGSFCKEKNNALIGSVKYNPAKQNEIISTMFDLYEEQTNEDETQKHVSLFLWLHIVFPLLKREKHHPDIECRIVTVCGNEKNNQTNIIGKIKDQIAFDSKDIRLLG